jgi:hypothetical protein
VRGQKALSERSPLLEGEVAEVRRAHEVVEETTRGLFDATADVEWQWEESKRGHREQLEELTLF